MFKISLVTVGYTFIALRKLFGVATEAPFVLNRMVVVERAGNRMFADPLLKAVVFSFNALTECDTNVSS